MLKKGQLGNKMSTGGEEVEGSGHPRILSYRRPSLSVTLPSISSSPLKREETFVQAKFIPFDDHTSGVKRIEYPISYQHHLLCGRLW